MYKLITRSKIAAQNRQSMVSGCFYSVNEIYTVIFR